MKVAGPEAQQAQCGGYRCAGEEVDVSGQGDPLDLPTYRLLATTYVAPSWHALNCGQVAARPDLVDPDDHPARRSGSAEHVREHHTCCRA